MRHLIKFAVAALFLLGLFAPSFQAGSNVADLTSSTFDSFIADNEFALVEFFAPWCGHCKALAPEYEKAADQLAAEGSPIKLAKVDCTKEEELGNRFQIQGYPTLKWFKNGKPTEYNGPREAAGIVSWVSKRSGPATKTPSTKEELNALIENNNVVVGYFEKDSDAHKAFLEAASAPQAEQYTFVDVVSEDLLKEAGAAAGTVKLYRPFGEPLTLEGEVTSKGVISLVQAHGFPYFEHAQSAWGRHIDRGLEYILLIVGDTQNEAWSSLTTYATKLATEFVDKVGISWLGSDFFGRVTQFGLSGKNFPAAFIMAPQREKTYIHDEATPLSEESLKKFIEGVLDGSIRPNFKSEEAPATNDGPVTVLVGNTFEELVIKNDKDVFVEFYAPWCGHCKTLAPIWEQLGKVFAANENVVIAKMDSTANDNDHVSIKGFPTLVFFPAGSKDKPVTYQGPRTLEALSQFVSQNAKNVEGAAGEDAHDEL